MWQKVGEKLNYIIMDLEWNQCPEGKRKEVKAIPFEIIEIGAVKLNEKLEIMEEFSEKIKPQVYKKMDQHVGEIIQTTMKDLKNCRKFSLVAEDFLKWCGEEPVFCTWGTLDLTELQRNMSYYKMAALAKKPFFYYDVQNLFEIFFDEEKATRNLAYAVEYFQIEQRGRFHTAINDARYTALIMQKFDTKKIKKYQAIDYFHYPKVPEDEVYVSFSSYAKFISMGYPGKEALMNAQTVREVKCCVCDKRVAKKIDWFTNNSKNYYGLFLCKEHGYLKGKVRAKRGLGEEFFAVKTVKIISKDEAKRLSKQKARITAKRARKQNNICSDNEQRNKI